MSALLVLLFAAALSLASNSTGRCSAQDSEALLADMGIPIPGDEYWVQDNPQLWADEQIRCLHVQGETLFAGGQFDSIGAVAARRIAAWNGDSWSPLGGGIGDEEYGSASEVETIPIDSTGVYVVGSFWEADGGVDAWSAARWDGTGWHGLAHFNASANCIEEFAGARVVGGGFDHVDGEVVWKIARETSGSWEQIGEGFNYLVLDMAVYEGTLIAGGTFTRSGETYLNYIARWDGQQWQPMGEGFDNYVKVMEVIDGELYVGGSFEYSGSEWMGHLAKWNGSGWESIGGGVAPMGPGAGVAAFAKYQGNLYIGGQFEYVGGVWARNIAYWDGATWNRLGAGTDRWVFALAEYQGALFVGGWFNLAGGQSAQNIAVWRPTTTGTPGELPAGDEPFIVSHCSPNPFSPNTALHFTARVSAAVAIDIYDVAGRRVKHLGAGEFPVGEHSVVWLGDDDEGKAVASGVYYLVLSSGSHRVARKVVLAR